jgi:hypothetical protein
MVMMTMIVVMSALEVMVIVGMSVMMRVCGLQNVGMGMKHAISMDVPDDWLDR